MHEKTAGEGGGKGVAKKIIALIIYLESLCDRALPLLTPSKRPVAKLGPTALSVYSAPHPESFPPLKNKIFSQPLKRIRKILVLNSHWRCIKAGPLSIFQVHDMLSKNVATGLRAISECAEDFAAGCLSRGFTEREGIFTYLFIYLFIYLLPVNLTTDDKS